MKRFLLFLFIITACKAQKNTYNHANNDIGCAQVWNLNYNPTLQIPNGCHIKDINGVFNSYIGTWQGTWNEKEFSLKIEKYADQLHSYPDGSYYYEDRLVGKYEVKEIATGILIESTMNLSIDNAKIKSLGSPKNSEFNFLYSDKDKCYTTGKFQLDGNPSSNQLQYFYFEQEFWISQDCPYDVKEQLPVNIPEVTMTLTRVN